MTLNARLSQNTIILLISSAGSAIFSFVLTVIIGRVLGEEGLGVYATVLAWIFPLSLMVEFGLGTLITRDVAQDIANGPAYLHATTIARLVIGGSAASLIVLLAPLMSDNPATIEGLRISAPIVIILPMFGMFTALFRAHQVMWPIPLLNIGMLVIQTALVIIVFAKGGDVKAALIVNTTTSMAQLLVAWMMYRKWFASNRTTAQRARTKPLPVYGEGLGWGQGGALDIIILLKRAWPFAIAAFIGALQIRIGIILVEQFAGTSEAGLFAAASRFVDAARMLPNAFFGALFPALATIVANPTKMQRLFKRAAFGLSGYSIAAGIITGLLAPVAIPSIFGDEFNDTILILQILIWSLLPALLRGSRTLYWYALQREHYVNVVNLIAVGLQVFLSLWLIPSHGAAGAAVAIVLTESIAMILLFREVRLPILWPMQHEQR